MGSVLPWKRLCLVTFVAGLVSCHSRAGEVNLPVNGLHPPEVAGCRVFPADNVWNVRVDGLPVDSRSKEYLAAIGLSKPVHADFGPDAGIPYAVVPVGTPAAVVRFEYKDESDAGDYSIPAGVAIEGGGGSEGDRHILLIDPKGCVLEELFAAERQVDGAGKGYWTAGSGIRMSLKSNALRPEGWTSADAAGLPVFPGLVRYDEVAAGAIEHALRFTVPRTRASYVWPARHKASRDGSANLLPMGARLRLRADFDVSGYSRTNQVILIALKRYGMFLADNGGAMFLTGAPDNRWDNSDLHRLGGVKAADFEVVDESGLEVEAGSARVRLDSGR